VVTIGSLETRVDLLLLSMVNLDVILSMVSYQMFCYMALSQVRESVIYDLIARFCTILVFGLRHTC